MVGRKKWLQGDQVNWLILSTLFVQIVLLILVSQRLANLEKIFANSGPQIVERVPDEQGHTLGPKDAPITVVEFADFQCPYCANAESTLRQIISNYPNEIRFVYRHLPLTSVHPYAFQAAEASECANEQKMFWEMHDSLFENQQNYPEEDSSTMAFFSDLANEIGLDIASFRDCLQNQTYASYVSQDMDDGFKYGVNGTPTFFVNQQKVVGVSNLETVIIDTLGEAD